MTTPVLGTTRADSRLLTSTGAWPPAGQLAPRVPGEAATEESGDGKPRERGRWTSVVTILGVLVAIVVSSSIGVPHLSSPPDALAGGWRLDPTGDGARSAAALREQADRMGLHHVQAASYAEVRGSRVVFVGGDAGSGGGRKTFEQLTAAAGQPAAHTLHVGKVRCAEASAVVMCGWYDDDTAAVAVSSQASVDEVAEVTALLRERTERR